MSGADDAALVLRMTIDDAGWGDLDVTQGATHCKIEGFSYTTDALGDLVRAALLLATGQHTATVHFDGEPMEWRLIVGPHWRDSRWQSSKLRILIFDNIYKEAAEADGKSVLEIECDSNAFVKAVAAMTERVLSDVGETDYEQHWGMAFPMAALRALRYLQST